MNRIPEEITCGLQPPHIKSLVQRKRAIAIFPEGHRGNALQVSGRVPRLHATNVVFSGFVGGRYHKGLKVSKPGTGRGESVVWGVSETLGSTPPPVHIFNRDRP